MLWKLFLVFAIVPAVELYLLIRVGTIIGAFNTVLLVIATAAVGAYMVRLEGLNVALRFQQNLQDGIFPGEEIFDGAMLLVAGALLVTPGLLTDTAGFLIVIPPSRAALKRFIRKRIEKSSFVIRVE